MPAVIHLLVPNMSATLFADLSAPGVTEAVKLASNIAVALSGTATNVEVVIERSARNPDGTPTWVKVGASITGNLTTGIDVQAYLEPGTAWWRARVVTLTGGNVKIDISGRNGVSQ